MLAMPVGSLSFGHRIMASSNWRSSRLLSFPRIVIGLSAAGSLDHLSRILTRYLDTLNCIESLVTSKAFATNKFKVSRSFNRPVLMGNCLIFVLRRDKYFNSKSSLIPLGRASKIT
ncbi:hypothetical protein AAHA92_25791 [Salvia divinorum]|uniref:Uncharacterized protein n=1 Tax=Salvia divinorum TaxID=28513 RepID=A0ABD1GBT4_SALDI